MDGRWCGNVKVSDDALRCNVSVESLEALVKEEGNVRVGAQILISTREETICFSKT